VKAIFVDGPMHGETRELTDNPVRYVCKTPEDCKAKLWEGVGPVEPPVSVGTRNHYYHRGATTPRGTVIFVYAG
jgi:hypothetical protein